MNVVEPFRSRRPAQGLAEQIRTLAGNTVMTFMEVCGTHTMSAFRHGIRGLLPENVRLISGPGCPVCVTPNRYFDHAVALARLDRVVLATFGDMMRVPGSTSSLEQERGRGADIRVVYSPLDAVHIAEENPDRKIVFLGVGFETTAPTIAASVLEAERRGVSNYHVLVTHKVMPPAMRALVTDPDLQVDGFLCPGHVSTIIGAEPYRFIAEEYGVPCVIAGFEPVDILQALRMLVAQKSEGRSQVEIQYRRVVRWEGNPKAWGLVQTVFEPTDASWRGLGVIPGSGLQFREAFQAFDAETVFDVEIEPTREPKGCLCGEVLKGKCIPTDCALFGTACRPEHPVGACMVSSEGTCAAWLKYGGMFRAN